MFVCFFPGEVQIFPTSKMFYNGSYGSLIFLADIQEEVQKFQMFPNIIGIYRFVSMERKAGSEEDTLLSWYLYVLGRSLTKVLMEAAHREV